jgi:hypothetical protein
MEKGFDASMDILPHLHDRRDKNGYNDKGVEVGLHEVL